MRQWIQFIVLLSVFCVGFLRGQEADIASLIAAVNQDTLITTVRRLSGEIPIQIGGQKRTIRSRNKHYPGNDLAADYIASKLAGWGLEVENHRFSETGRNVLGFQEGTRYPGKKYILSAHYDSMPDSAISPGADDNASGVAVVLEAARILSGTSLKSSVVYAFWDEEEYGYYGSAAYAARADSRHEDIRGVLNLDMIGWDSDGDFQILFDVGESLDEYDLFDTALDVNDLHEIGLTSSATTNSIWSDQQSFRDEGFPALGIHEYFFGDENDFYHSTDDRVMHFNPDYFLRCSRLAVGALASLALDEPLVAVESEPPASTDFMLAQNYPNPFNPATVISYAIPEPAHVSIQVWDERGRLVATLLDVWEERGSHAATFDGSDLPSGVYTYRIQADGFLQSRKMLLLK